MFNVGFKRTALLLMLASGLAGCDQVFPQKVPAAEPAEAAPATAVIDLVAVAKAVGRDEVFKENVESAAGQIREKLTQFATNLQSQIREKQAAMGENPSDEQRRELQQLVVQAQRELQRGQGMAEQRAQEYRLTLARQFREQVRPIAERVAVAAGAQVVLTASDTVLWHDSALDITDEVIAELRANPLPPLPPPKVEMQTDGKDTPAVQ